MLEKMELLLWYQHPLKIWNIGNSSSTWRVAEKPSRKGIKGSLNPSDKTSVLGKTTAKSSSISQTIFVPSLFLRFRWCFLFLGLGWFWQGLDRRGWLRLVGRLRVRVSWRRTVKTNWKWIGFNLFHRVLSLFILPKVFIAPVFGKTHCFFWNLRVFYK